MEITMGYYVYENWTVLGASGKARVHRGECPFCKNGQGTIKPKEPGKHGRWRKESFPDRESAFAYARSSGFTDIRVCKKCNP
jgi:hypothetical protein